MLFLFLFAGSRFPVTRPFPAKPEDSFDIFVGYGAAISHHRRCVRILLVEIYYCVTVPNGHSMNSFRLPVYGQTRLICKRLEKAPLQSRRPLLWLSPSGGMMTINWTIANTKNLGHSLHVMIYSACYHLALNLLHSFGYETDMQTFNLRFNCISPICLMTTASRPITSDAQAKR